MQKFTSKNKGGNPKDPNTDSGKYIDGIYTTKNGFSGLGINCPKGTRLYDTSLQDAVFFVPEDTPPDEHFKIITQEVAPNIMPYYAVSNYGRVLNIKSGQIMKPNYRPSGYEYLCLAAENSKNGQKKYSTHRLVLKTFKPIDNMDSLTVNHINGNKSDNYVNKRMDDGRIESNLEWMTSKENVNHAYDTGLRNNIHSKLTKDDAAIIRHMRDEGYSYEQILKNGYDFVSSGSIRNVCLNKTFKDPNYIPKSYNDSYQSNPANIHKLTDNDANKIRLLANKGFTYNEIKTNFYPDFSIATISDICRNVTHTRNIT